jgi:hypothetical protein
MMQVTILKYANFTISNIYSYFMQRAGGRLYGIAKMGQHEYDATDEL